MTAPVQADIPAPICSVKVAQTTPWVQLDIGQTSILFSYGRPVGISHKNEVFVLASNKSTTKHLNRWRDFRAHKEVPQGSFDTILRVAVTTALKEIK